MMQEDPIEAALMARMKKATKPRESGKKSTGSKSRSTTKGKKSGRKRKTKKPVGIDMGAVMDLVDRIDPSDQKYYRLYERFSAPQRPKQKKPSAPREGTLPWIFMRFINEHFGEVVRYG